MGGASPYLGAVRAEHVGPAARSLRFALLEPPGLGALLSVRRANVRSRSEIRKFASEGTKQGGGTTRRPSLTLLDPLLVNFRARVSHHHSPCRAAVRTCRAAMELQGGRPERYSLLFLKLLDIHGDSAARDPAHCRDQRTRVSSGKRHGSRAPGLRSCRTSGRRRALERSC